MMLSLSLKESPVQLLKLSRAIEPGYSDEWPPGEGQQDSVIGPTHTVTV